MANKKPYTLEDSDEWFLKLDNLIWYVTLHAMSGVGNELPNSKSHRWWFSNDGFGAQFKL